MDRLVYQKIIAEYGTPVYVLDQAELDRSIGEVKDSLSNLPMEVHVAYPYKANFLRRLCEYMNLQGMWAEVSSGLEMQMALEVSVEPKHIIFNSPYKSSEDLGAALQMGCQVNVDNMEEFERISGIVKASGIREQAIGVRVSPVSGTYWDKFGFALEHEAYTALTHMSKKPGIRLVGLHVHRSNIARLEDYEEHIAKVLQFACKVSHEGIVQLEHINIGSGFAVDYPKPISVSNWTAPTMKQYVQVISNAWREASLPEEVSLIVEPGRRLVASCITLLTRAVSIKDRPDGKVVIVDVGGNLLPGIDLYRHPISQTRDIDKSMIEERYAIHGCLCDSLDVVSEEVPLFSLEIGELLCIGNVGGYDMSRSFTWQLPRPPVIWINNEGESELVRSREEVEYLWQLCI